MPNTVKHKIMWIWLAKLKDVNDLLHCLTQLYESKDVGLLAGNMNLFRYAKIAKDMVKIWLICLV